MLCLGSDGLAREDSFMCVRARTKTERFDTSLVSALMTWGLRRLRRPLTGRAIVGEDQRLIVLQVLEDYLPIRHTNVEDTDLLELLAAR